MKRTSLFLDEPLLAALARAAKRRGVSVAAIVREAAAAYVAAPAARPLPSFTGKYRSGRTDLSERAEELLWNDPHR